MQNVKKKRCRKEKQGLPTLGFLIAWGTGNLDKYTRIQGAEMSDLNEFRRLERKAEKRVALEFWILLLVMTVLFFVIFIIEILRSENAGNAF